MNDENASLLIVVFCIWITATGSFLLGRYVTQLQHKNGCAEDVMTSYMDGVKEGRGGK